MLSQTMACGQSPQQACQGADWRVSPISIPRVIPSLAQTTLIHLRLPCQSIRNVSPIVPAKLLLAAKKLALAPILRVK